MSGPENRSSPCPTLEDHLKGCHQCCDKGCWRMPWRFLGRVTDLGERAKEASRRGDVTWCPEKWEGTRQPGEGLGMGKKEAFQGKQPDRDKPHLKKSVGQVTPWPNCMHHRMAGGRRQGGRKVVRKGSQASQVILKGWHCLLMRTEPQKNWLKKGSNPLRKTQTQWLRDSLVDGWMWAESAVMGPGGLARW